ncbi:MAG: twin-arginine translocation signal domain-containing protein, partial [Pseudomonadota bacterium]|nr:twin-arginine translocation signal domain-containing protein [Pseudomonadota bacterium]
MRTLVRKLLDEQISRRGFVKEMAALGVTVSSAQALMGSLSTASADEAGDEVAVREVTGNGGDLIMETLIEADVEYIFHGCGAG